MLKSVLMVIGFASLVTIGSTLKADEPTSTRVDRADRWLAADGNPVLTLAQADQNEPTKETTPAEETKSAIEMYEYREVSDFFNIREANPQVRRYEWEFEYEVRWFTRSNGSDDDLGMAQSLKYGFTDNMFLELEVVEPNLGDGGNSGAGDMNLVLFNRFVKETSSMPAIAAFVEMRVPSGDGSEGVDASLHGIVTKSFAEKCRMHVEGYVKSANGGYGGEDDRKHFQWGVGVGADYLVCKELLLLANFINRTSEAEHGHNENVLELGLVQEICRNDKVAHHIKFATDIGLDGASETANLGAKIQWSIDWK